MMLVYMNVDWQWRQKEDKELLPKFTQKKTSCYHHELDKRTQGQAKELEIGEYRLELKTLKP